MKPEHLDKQIRTLERASIPHWPFWLTWDDLDDHFYHVVEQNSLMQKLKDEDPWVDWFVVNQDLNALNLFKTGNTTVPYLASRFRLIRDGRLVTNPGIHSTMTTIASQKMLTEKWYAGLRSE